MLPGNSRTIIEFDGLYLQSMIKYILVIDRNKKGMYKSMADYHASLQPSLDSAVFCVFCLEFISLVAQGIHGDFICCRRENFNLPRKVYQHFISSYFVFFFMINETKKLHFCIFLYTSWLDLILFHFCVVSWLIVFGSEHPSVAIYTLGCSSLLVLTNDFCLLDQEHGECS